MYRNRPVQGAKRIDIPVFMEYHNKKCCKRGVVAVISAAVVEDSAQDQERLVSSLVRFGKETGNQVQIDNYLTAEQLLRDYHARYDVIFFDIGLPGMDGMKAAAELRKLDRRVYLIFVTDMAQYALKGYKVGALDYFVKPVSYYDVKLRMDYICMMKSMIPPAIVIHIPGQMDQVMNSDDVYYIEVRDKQLTYHTVHGDYTTRSIGLKKLEEELSACGFCRCSGSYLVNLKWCRGLMKNEVLVGSDLLPIGRTMRAAFISRLSQSVSALRGFAERG